MMVPLAHIGALLVVYILMGRRAPIGTDVSIFLTTAILPFVLWSYTHQRMSRTMLENRPLLSFPTIRFVDIAIAQAIVELLSSTFIASIVYAALVISGSDVLFVDPPPVLFVLIMSYILGVSTGLVLSIIGLVVPGTMIVAFILIPLYWVTSGALFIPDALPEQAKAAVAVFPLAHIVDYGRTAYYPRYLSSFPNLYYVLFVIVANFFAFMAATRFFKAQLTAR